MASSPIPTLEEFERSTIARTGVRALVSVIVLLAAYYVVPAAHRAHEAIGVRLGVSMALFVAVLSLEVRAITRHAQPMLRAVVAMATVIPLFLVLFAWIYLTMSRSDPAAFGQVLDRDSALYFAVTVFSTVGFGDIVAKTDTARLVVTVQMLADLAVVAVVIRLILGAASRGEARKSPPPDHPVSPADAGIASGPRHPDAGSPAGV